MKGKLIAGLGLIALLSTGALADTIPAPGKSNREVPVAKCKVSASYWSGTARQRQVAGMFEAKDDAFKTILKAANERRAENGFGPWQADYFRVNVWPDGSVVIGMFKDDCLIPDSLAVYSGRAWSKTMADFRLTFDDFNMLEDGDNPIHGTAI